MILVKFLMVNQLKLKNIKLSIPKVNTIFSKLNKGNIPQELKIFYRW